MEESRSRFENSLKPIPSSNNRDHLYDFATIGFDIGGTNTRICIHSNRGFVELIPPGGIELKGIGSRSIRLKDIYSYRLDTPSRYLYQRKHRKIPSTLEIQNLILDRLVSSIRFLIKAYPNVNIRNVGISFAGPVKKEQDDLIEDAVNIWGVGNFNLKAELIKKLKYEDASIRNITIVVDDEAAGYRYLRQTKYTQGITELHYLTISSGHSGVRINLDTKELTPYESGHWQVIKDIEDPLYLPCNCGGEGHLETLVAGRGSEKLVRLLFRQDEYCDYFKRSPLANKDIREIATGDVVQAAKKGDRFALEIVKISAKYLSRYVILPIIRDAQDRDSLMVIINGGYARALGPKIYLRMVKAEMKELISDNPIHGFSVEKINDLVVMGIDDDNDALHGAVFIAEDTYKAIWCETTGD